MRKLLIPVIVAGLFCPVAHAQDRSRTKTVDPPAKRSEVDQLREDVRVLRERVAALEQQVSALNAEIVRLSPKPRDPKADAVAAAIRQHRVVTGMTLEQVRQVIGNQGELLQSEGEFTTYRWSGIAAHYYVPDAPESAGSLICDFDNGKMTGMRFGRGGTATEVR